MKKPVTVAILGAGNRGREAYGQYILKHPGDIKAVAIAEPDDKKRELFAREHNIDKNMQFKTWEDLLALDKLADGIIIATMDNMHVEPTIEALNKGYKILLEKPIAPDLDSTLKIYGAAKDTNSIMVAHVLRYTKFYRTLKDLLDKGVIGNIRFVDHIENIGYYHFAHSYVRGNWRNTKKAAPIILAKSCHDLDLLYWLVNKKCIELSSDASLEHFIPENMPEGAGERCINCQIEENCPYSARKIYLKNNAGEWPASVISSDQSYQGRYRALETGPYGRCVYNCDNNVPEVQTVRMKFSDNLEVNFALTAFSQEINRTTRIFGSLGEIRADFENGLIELYRFGHSRDIIKIENDEGGHGGGDTGLMNQFVKLLQGNTELSDLTTIAASLESHIMAFAAEEARKKKTVYKLNELRKKLERR